MSEINCHGDEVIYGDVIPEWYLVQLVNLAVNNYDLPIVDRTVQLVVSGNVMGEGNFGLVCTNNPIFVFSMPPRLKPPTSEEFKRTNRFSEDEELYYKTLEHYTSRLCCSVDKGYDFYVDCLEAGYNPREHNHLDGLAEWLMPKIYHVWKRGPVITYPYPNKEPIIHQADKDTTSD